MSINIQRLKTSPWLWFSPYLILFIVGILIFHTDKMEGDEQRYIRYAINLCNGYYSPPNKISLWNGPGYPIVLMPFVALKAPLISITLFHALLQYISIILVYYTLVALVSRKTALILSLGWASYYVAYQEMPNIVTETFTSFLVSLSAFFLIQSTRSKRIIYTLLTGLSLGFLVLTKIIFGYVLLVTLCLYSIYYLISVLSFKHKGAHIKKTLLSMVVALMVISPYLLYTYSITGRSLYFGTGGGNLLYWMSTPYENEYGEWNLSTFDAYCKPGRPCNAEFIRSNHQKDFDSIKHLKSVEKDDAFKQMAIRNIKNYPLKYFRNWICNIGRLWFGYPTSAFYERDILLARFLPNSILLTFFVLGLFLWVINLKRWPAEINFLIIFYCIYLSASSLVSAVPRQLYVIVPAIIVSLGFIISELFSFRLRLTNHGIETKH